MTGILAWTIGDIINDRFGDPTADTFEMIYRAVSCRMPAYYIRR
jgi:hypothetical protein